MNHRPLSKAPPRLHSTFKDAVEELQQKLEPADFDIIRTAQGVQDVLKVVDDAIKQANLAPEQVQFARFREVLAIVVRWLDKNSVAIDMVVQSGPQICGLSLMGLIWGGLKFLVIVCPLLCPATMALALNRRQKISQTRLR